MSSSIGVPGPAELSTPELLRAMTRSAKLPSSFVEACIRELAARIDGKDEQGEPGDVEVKVPFDAVLYERLRSLASSEDRSVVAEIRRLVKDAVRL